MNVVGIKVQTDGFELRTQTVTQLRETLRAMREAYGELTLEQYLALANKKVC